MAKLIFLGNVSLDLYVADENGSFDWGAPSDELFAFINDLMRPIGTHLYGRRNYDLMTMWETDPSFAARSALMADFANLWQATDKVVYSTTLEAASTKRTRLERSFDPDAVRALKDSATSDLLIAGPNLAAQAFAAGLVDECHLLIRPILLGGGKPALPSGVRADLELLEDRRIGTVEYLRYRVVAQ